MVEPTEHDRKMATQLIDEQNLNLPALDEAVAQALADAREEGRREASWRPIETAPKDGTVLDLWVTYQKNSSFSERATNCRWDDDAEPKGWWNDDGLIEWGPDKYEQSCVVTHWRPLPEAPADG